MTGVNAIFYLTTRNVPNLARDVIFDIAMGMHLQIACELPRRNEQRAKIPIYRLNPLFIDLEIERAVHERKCNAAKFLENENIRFNSTVV
jgi:hypothetical protein